MKACGGGGIEIILVDDGSIDKSPQICDEYVKRNKILKVIHKRNAGAASARNTGLEIAKGKWVTFIDPDDTVVTDYLLEILKMIKKYPEVDCILFGMMIKNAKDEKTYFYDNPYFCGEIADWLRIVEKKGLLNYPWNKIYKRELIEKDSPVRFPEGKEPGEDFLFNCEYMERCKNGVMLEKHLYVYHKQCNAEESLSHRFWPDLNEKTELFVKSRCHMYKQIGMCATDDERELAKQNLYYIYKCIPNMYKMGKWFEKKKRIIFYRKIIRDKQVKQWIVVDSNKERVIEIFKLLYRTKSPVICDMAYSLLFGIKNMINEVRSK